MEGKIMELKLHRKYIKKDYCIGNLYIDGQFFCNTLEDQNRDLNKNGKFDGLEKKVAGETCIPFGRYEVVVSMSPKFKRELPLLLNVPEFEGIRIHRGNTIKDTAGCILVGENKEVGKVLNSSHYEIKITEMIKQATLGGSKCFITIV